MEKRYYIKLTQAVYRTTEKFPEGESLKAKIRDKANEILADLVLNDPNTKEQTLKAIELLESYFEIARFQNWVNPLNFIILSQEYNNVAEELRNKNNESAKEQKEREEKAEVSLVKKEIQSPTIITEVGLQTPIKPVEKSGKYLDRHQKILDFLREQGQAQVWEVKQVLANVSKRTIRRDFEYLVEQNLVERIGERNNTFYRAR